jgi:hypothetical protein
MVRNGNAGKPAPRRQLNQILHAQLSIGTGGMRMQIRKTSLGGMALTRRAVPNWLNLNHNVHAPPEKSL